MDTRSWMATVDPDTYLTDLHLPGTHDSAAMRSILFSKTPPLEKTPALEQLRKLSSVPGISFFAKKWTITQSLTIKQQLAAGNRAFDFRFLYNQQDGKLYLGHSFVVAEMQTVLQDIRSFMDNHPGEVIVITIKSDYEHRIKTQGKHDTCYNLIKKILDPLLIKQDITRPGLYTEKFKLGNLQKANERILLVYDEYLKDHQNTHSDVWSNVVIDPHWANKTEAKEVVEHFENKPYANEVDYNKLKVCSPITTPDTGYIAKETTKKVFFPCYNPYGVLREAPEATQKMRQFFDKNPDFEKATNMMMMDNPSGDDFKWVINSNFK